MPSRRLLMLINFFPPAGGGGVYRPLSFVKYLSRMGWEITVVTPKAGEFWISDPTLERQIPDGVRVVRTGSLSASRVLGAFRGRKQGDRAGVRSSGRFEAMRRAGETLLLPDTYTGWRPFAIREALRLCRAERFDAIYSTSPPDSTHLAALKVAGRTGIPWLADFRDPWISLYLRDPVTPAHRKILERMERRVLLGADTVTVTTKWQEERIGGVAPGRRVVRIPNGYDEEDFAGETPGPPDTPMRMTHCGMLTLGRRSSVFLDGLARFIDRVPGARDELRVTFIGARESGNEPAGEKLSGVVEFEDNMPHAACVDLERKSHVLLLIKHDDERYNGLVPGKLFEYIGACRPVLALAPPGEAAEIVRGLNRGEVAPPGDAGEIAAALERIYSLWKKGSLDASCDLSPRPEFSRRAAAGEMDRQLALLADEGRAR